MGAMYGYLCSTFWLGRCFKNSWLGGMLALFPETLVLMHCDCTEIHSYVQSF